MISVFNEKGTVLSELCLTFQMDKPFCLAVNALLTEVFSQQVVDDSPVLIWV